ncbi:hypothetical protein BKA67DRAFT_593284 [Truncatella angustata]|uniref:J domain-containing protein n=1 Tax=Truncatella angustata TaxID=152316 RepID=A0A9P8UJQ3_9PEZI|nr:uncharacterized protein BKA67DRAFT_593284 [Truncatella angustata]KAH6653354.1 hypothetical protein BKA67DRAFT_593284 [Truncatella angustata]KAH8196401.1 hypothetical protein TruAng_009451 [Truncatella angustata]
MLKSSTLAVCSSSNLPTFIWPFPSITSPSAPTRPQLAKPVQQPQQRRRGPRSYATVNDRSRSCSGSPPPSKWPSCANPTPYQIFDQQKKAPYSKARFYELVKIYHPDRHRQTPGDKLTDDARLERYRLVVAANEVLSDPTKRRAYDLYGAGWNSIRSMDSTTYRHADTSWRKEPGNPSMNATWEDWERWYGERDGRPKQKQQPVFMSNELFVVVLCGFVVAASMGQARRASTTTMNIVEIRDQQHDAISSDIKRRRIEQGGLTRHERVESFLKQREGWNSPAATVPHGRQDDHDSKKD